MKYNKIMKKDGSIEYRKQIYLGIDDFTGKKVKARISAKTIKELGHKEMAKRLEFERNGRTTKTRVEVKTYAQLVTIWTETNFNSYKFHSVEMYKSQIKNYLLPAFGDFLLKKITVSVVQSVVNRWADNYNKGINHPYKKYNELHALNKRILNFAVSLGLIESNPCHNIIMPRKKPDDPKTKHLNSNQLKKWLAYLDDLPETYSNFYDKVFYKLLLATGCRMGELSALEWSDIDFNNDYININKTLQTNLEITSPKSKAGIRTISVDHKTMLLLRLYKNRQTQHFKSIGSPWTTVFAFGTRKYPKHNMLRARLNQHFKKCNLNGFSFHAFRHTHASLLINAGITPKELQYRLGHSNIATTLNVYTHLSKEKEKESVTFFEKAIASL